MPLHQTAGFAAAIQAAKGAAAGTGFVRGRMGTSSIPPRYDVVDNSGEHTGVNQRATIRKSTPIRAGYIADVTANWRLYPYLMPIGLALVGFKTVTSTGFAITITDGDIGDTFTLTYDDTGSNPQTTGSLAYDAEATAVASALNGLNNAPAGGFTVTGAAGGPYTVTASGAAVQGVGGGPPTLTVDATGMTSTVTSDAALSPGWYSHVQTLALPDEMAWGTIVQYLAEGDARYARMAYDCRASQLTIEATRSGISVAMSGLGLRESDAVGDEVMTQEPNRLLSQALGSFTLTSNDITAATMGVPIEHLLTLDNPLDEEDQELHSFYRADLAPTGVDISGELRNLTWGEDIFKEFIYGASAGTTPVIEIPEAALAWSFASPSNISDDIPVPYSTAFNVTLATVMMQPFDVTGGGKIRYNVQYQMLDPVTAEPITITTVNDFPSYAGG